MKELEDLTVGEFRKPGQSHMKQTLEAQERYYQEYKDKLPTGGVCRVICSDSVASLTLSSCSLKERNLSTFHWTMGRETEVDVRTNHRGEYSALGNSNQYNM